MGAPHHPVFERYPRWRGPVEPDRSADFLGVRTRHAYHLSEEVRAAIVPPEGDVEPDLPGFNEEYFEWIDVLEAVDAADERFTMVELGAGWGRWLAIGAAAARGRGLPYLLVGVEAEPTHFRWLVEHLAENDFPPEALRLHEAAVAGADGSAHFLVGDPLASYGQAIVEAPPPPPRTPAGWVKSKLWPLDRPSTKHVRTLSLPTVLADLDLVDLIDLDVQGVEAEVLEGGAAELDARVKRVHVGTHSGDNEERCRLLFGRLGWTKLNDYACGDDVDTPYGGISFQDGVQTWVNPRLA